MNKLKAFSTRKVRQSRSAMISVSLTLVLLVGFALTSSQTVISYNKMQEIDSRNNEMRQTIKDWETKVSYINKQEYRPIAEDMTGAVTSDILVSAQNHGLAMTDFKAAMPNQKKDSYERTYTLSLSGSYENTVAFLTTFHARDALINILSLKMQPQNGIIQTQIKYRIYIKK